MITNSRFPISATESSLLDSIVPEWGLGVRGKTNVILWTK